MFTFGHRRHGPALVIHRAERNARSTPQNDRLLGIDKTVRMAIVGHKTEAQHDDYDAAARPEVAAASKAIGDFLVPALAPTSVPYQQPYSGKAATEAAANPFENLELVTGIEPVTPSLRVTCSTS